MTEESIADSVRKCFEHFNLLQQVEPRLATDSDRKAVRETVGEEARFKIWSGNIGAHSTGRRSLQYRLRDASHLQKQVKSLLEELSELLADAYAIAIGKKVPWDHIEDDGSSMGSDYDTESDDVPAAEMDQISQNVSDVIDCLLRLSVAIRNPAPHDRFATFASIDASHYEPYDIEHVRSKFSKIEPFLAERLGRAISRRRQYLKYRESHHSKLSHGLNCQEAKDESTVASSLPQHAKAAGFNVEAVDEDEASDSGITKTSFASSHTGGDKLRVPPLPREAENGPFECPFCYMMIIATGSLSWKRHVFADLRPYVCLSKDCTASEMEFMRRREWMLHEVQNHWRTYPCPYACGMAYPTKPLCLDHVSKSHPDAFSNNQVSSMIDLSSKPIQAEDGTCCLLCEEPVHWMKDYQRHVGRHQEQLALFALPSIETGDDDARPEDDGSGMDSNISSDTHREQATVEDDHGSFVKPLEDENDDALIILEGARASASEEPSTVPQGNSEKEWEAPAGSKWTKISRRVVNPEALKTGKENFEISGDFIIVLRVLSPEEIGRYVSVTQALRLERQYLREDELYLRGMESRGKDTVSEGINEARMYSKALEDLPTTEHMRTSKDEAGTEKDIKLNEREASEEQDEGCFSPARAEQRQQCEIPPAHQQHQPPQPHLGFIVDTYDPDDVVLRGSPIMTPLRPKLEPSPSPPPDIPATQVSLDHIGGRSKSTRHKVRPSSGDAVLIACLDNGRDPEMAFDEESPGEDAPDTRSGMDRNDEVNTRLEDPEKALVNEQSSEFKERYRQEAYRAFREKTMQQRERSRKKDGNSKER